MKELIKRWLNGDLELLEDISDAAEIPDSSREELKKQKKEVLERLKNSKIYRTDFDGSIMFKIKNNKLKIETCSP